MDLSNRLADLGRREEALAAIEQAAGIYRQLAEARPDAFLPALASSLHTLANVLSMLNRAEEASAIRDEADAVVGASFQAPPRNAEGETGVQPSDP